MGQRSSEDRNPTRRPAEASLLHNNRVIRNRPRLAEGFLVDQTIVPSLVRRLVTIHASQALRRAPTFAQTVDLSAIVRTPLSHVRQVQ